MGKQESLRCECGGAAVRTKPIGEYRCLKCQRVAAAQFIASWGQLRITLVSKQSIVRARRDGHLVWIEHPKQAGE